MRKKNVVTTSAKLVVIHSGYLNKKSRESTLNTYLSQSHKKRFVVLTTEAILWFKVNICRLYSIYMLLMAVYVNLEKGRS